jgi:hypothetical protein
MEYHHYNTTATSTQIPHKSRRLYCTAGRAVYFPIPVLAYYTARPVQGQGLGGGRSGILGNSNNHCAF